MYEVVIWKEINARFFGRVFVKNITEVAAKGKQE